MGGVPRSNDLGSRLDRLERAVSNLQRQSTLSSASISEGNLTIRRGGSLRVIDGGSIVGEGEGSLDWEGDAHFGGDTDIGGDTTISGGTHISGDTDISGKLTVSSQAELLGNTHIGGNLTIDGTTYLGGQLTYGPGNRPALVDANAAQASGWQATNNGTIVSTSIPRPSGYSTVVVMAQANGFYSADFDVPRSDIPAFVIRINGTDSPIIARTPDNFETYWIVGAFTRKFSGSGAVNVSVRSYTGPNLSPASPENRLHLGAVAVFTE